MEYTKSDSRNYKTRPDKTQVVTSAGWQIVMSNTLNAIGEVTCPCKVFILNDIWSRIIAWYAWASTELTRGNTPINHPQLKDFSKDVKAHVSAHKEISMEMLEIICLLDAPIFEEIRVKAMEILSTRSIPITTKIDQLGYLYYKGIQATIISAIELNYGCKDLYLNNTKCPYAAYSKELKRCDMHDKIINGNLGFKLYFNDFYNLNDGAINRLNAICKYIKTPSENTLTISFELYETVYIEKIIEFLKKAKKKFKKVKVIKTKDVSLYNTCCTILGKENVKVCIDK